MNRESKDRISRIVTKNKKKTNLKQEQNGKLITMSIYNTQLESAMDDTTPKYMLDGRSILFVCLFFFYSI